MVRYYGRARQRTGSVNTNQLGLKMSGCPGKVGLNPVNNRYIQQRVACNRGVCGIPKVHGVDWRYSMSNAYPFCAEPSGKCLAAAGGIRNIRVPYYRTVQPGKQGCTHGGQFGNYPPNLNVDPVGLDARHFPFGHTPIVHSDGSITVLHVAKNYINIPGRGAPPAFSFHLAPFPTFKATPGIWVAPSDDSKLPDYFSFYAGSSKVVVINAGQTNNSPPPFAPAGAQFFTCERFFAQGVDIVVATWKQLHKWFQSKTNTKSGGFVTRTLPQGVTSGTGPSGAKCSWF